MRSSVQWSKQNISGENIAPAVTVGPYFKEMKEKTSYWNGKGADYKWSNPLNWVAEKIPTSADCVIFDGSCVKNVLVDINTEIKSLIITSDYTGCLSGWNDLTVLENVLIQGGIIEVCLLTGGDITIEKGIVNTCFSTQGNLTIAGGNISWISGEVAGNTLVTGGLLNFSNHYNRYYSFKGDVIIAGGKIEGNPLFRFQGNKPQVFQTSLEEIKVLDLYNYSQLNLQTNMTVEGWFFNAGTIKVSPAANLNLEDVKFFSNTGTLIAEGNITGHLKGKLVRRKNLEELSNIEIPAKEQLFAIKNLDSAQSTEKSLATIS
ncbi:MAG TPA: hypothetical protein V6D13_08770 [Halomicronema sp.]